MFDCGLGSFWYFGIYCFRFLFKTKLLVEALKLRDLLLSLESVSMVTVWLQLWQGVCHRSAVLSICPHLPFTNVGLVMPIVDYANFENDQKCLPFINKTVKLSQIALPSNWACISDWFVLPLWWPWPGTSALTVLLVVKTCGFFLCSRAVGIIRTSCQSDFQSCFIATLVSLFNQFHLSGNWVHPVLSLLWLWLLHSLQVR